MLHAESPETGKRQHCRLDDACCAPGQTRVDIAAQIDDLQIGAAMQKLRDSLETSNGL